MKGVRDGTSLSLHPNIVRLELLIDDDVANIVRSMLGQNKASKNWHKRCLARHKEIHFLSPNFLRSLIQQGVIVAKDSGGYRMTGNAIDLAGGELSIPPSVRGVVRNRLDPLNRINVRLLTP